MLDGIQGQLCLYDVLVPASFKVSVRTTEEFDFVLFMYTPNLIFYQILKKKKGLLHLTETGLS